ncbi:NAD(P)H-dependent glycerol-3-phosphate dehydrogenase [Henriciella marina]|jgi:glycerol-3-phosphate dehydrogenase (NAD(P)+)|uniref:Glycerol-3-phosphate dehydrogenase [NAD(P)+] n=1 Tax=Henriciella marina TaxID=453851 RepID=A0ABT4LRA1_9PROT|nr:NAD(P)H-dependent glycerol-3-phosphate dehydrogenase [Henriciella marina]MCH2457878.1 NAD(P)-dependent glycerol-3-phosphate dehydrogenase [Henriciella sp.]MCZ4296855.1 NAD(P)-dependent glycerol-3-phosphate dehydrogenase [Henriciella marina]
MQTIGVLGAGAWGTALAATATKAGRDVRVWALEAEVAEALSAGKGNPVFLPDIELPKMQASSDMSILADCEAILSVVPAQHARACFNQLNQYLTPGVPVLLCSKGIEKNTLSLMTDVVHETMPKATPAVLSGPSFAADVARGLPTAVTLACADEKLGQTLMKAIGRSAFRPYWSNDLIGAEIGGAVKNVLAIACGIVEGLELGKSAHAALISRGFAEMTRLAVAMGAQQQTLAGLCGLGDLVLTCSSPQSRNMSFGMALGQGRSAQDILAERNSVTEGVATAPALTELAAREGVAMPICQAVHEILAGQKNVDEAMTALLNRPFKHEGF